MGADANPGTPHPAAPSATAPTASPRSTSRREKRAVVSPPLNGRSLRIAARTLLDIRDIQDIRVFGFCWPPSYTLYARAPQGVVLGVTDGVAVDCGAGVIVGCGFGFGVAVGRGAGG